MFKIRKTNNSSRDSKNRGNNRVFLSGFFVFLAAIITFGILKVVNVSYTYSQTSWQISTANTEISIAAGNRAFASDVRVVSERITDENILKLASRAAGINSKEVLAFNISFLDKENNEKQPNNRVRVTLRPNDYKLDADRYALVHIDDYGTAKYLGNIVADSGREVTFYAEKFSIYAIIPTTQTDQQRYARVTYNFYVEDELVATQTVRNQDILNAPAAPSRQGLIFMGWYTENDRVFNGLNLPVDIPDGTTADKTVNLHARFADKIYSVLFFNPQGNVLATKTGTTNDVINTDDIRYEVSSGRFVDQWTTDPSVLDIYAACTNVNECDIPDNITIGNTVGSNITITNENISLYPVVRSVKWVHYHANDEDDDAYTAASYTASNYAFYGQTVSAPTDPVRNGYDFVGWYENPEGTGSAFDFPNRPLTRDVDLYAIWRPHTNTQYRIIFWKEALVDNHYVEGNYEYAAYVDATGTSGSTITVTQAQINSIFNRADSLAYYEYDHAEEGAILHGDGSTIVNAYLKLKVYTVTFTVETNRNGGAASGNNYCFNYYGRNSSSASTSCRTSSYSSGTGTPTMSAIYTDMAGNTHDLVQGYSFTARMGESIIDRYPGSTEIALTHSGVSNVKAYSWRALSSNPDQTNRVSKPVTMIDTLLLSDHSAGVTLYLVGAVTTYPAEVNYWFENADGTGYEKSDEYSFTANSTGTGAFNGRVVPGYTLLSNPPTGYPRSDTGHTNATNVTNLYYSRNKYSLDFYNYNTAGNSHSNIPHSSSLTLYDYIPERPSGLSSAYTFQGWYTTPEYIDGTEFDLTTERMPINNLMLYAKWENTNYVTLTFNPNGGNEIPSQRVLYGNTARPVSDPARVGYTFVGWRRTDGSFFSFDNVLLEDTELVASWVPFDTIYVDYDPNGGVLYNEDNLSYVDTSTTAILPEPDEYPEGKYFVGWNVNGRIYYPGNVVMILLSDIENNGNTLTIVAEWGKEVDKTSYTYDPNGATGEQVTFEQEQNIAFTVKTPQELGYTKTGYTFTGWNSAADGSGVTYRPNTQWAADNRADLPNILYAQWEINCYTVTVEHIYEDGTEYDETETFQKCYGDTYETHASTKDNNYYGTVTSGQASGTITDSDVTVVYTYRIRDAVIYVHHVDENGVELKPTEEIPTTFNLPYDIQPHPELTPYYDYTSDVPTTGTVSGDVTITFTYTKKTFVLTVEHKYQDSNEEYDTTQTDNYLYLDPYSTSASTRDNNYEVVQIDGETSGTITGNTTVIYYYAKKKATVTAIHQDQNGNQLADPVTQENVEWGETYQTTPSGDLTPYYNYTTDISETGVVSGDVTVTYTYTPKQFTITVIHRSGPDNEISRETITKTYGDSYTTSPLNDPAWTLISTDGVTSGPATEDATVIYTYKVATYTVTIHHVIVDGETQTITQEVDYGDYCTAAPLAPLLIAYNYTQEGDCTTPITGNREITFTYTLKSFTITVRHIDEDGQPLLNDIVTPHDYGYEYTISPSDELAVSHVCTTNDSTTGTLTSSVTITYNCVKRHYNLIVHHLKEDGTNLTNDTITDYAYGDPYEAQPSTADPNYEVIRTEGDATGTIHGETTVTFIYAKRKAVLTVTHKDSSGTTLAPTQTENKEWGDPYTTSPASSLLEAYTYTTTGDDPNGTISGDTTVNYVYTLKKYDFIVRHVDASGNTLAPTETARLDHGSTYEAKPSAALTPMYNYTADKNTTGTISGDLTITFTYTKKIAHITVHHVNESGDTVAPDVTFDIEYGEVYTTTVSNQVPGNYEFKSRTDNYTDTAMSPTIEVTYTYQLKDPTLSSSIEIRNGADTINNSSQTTEYQIVYSANVGDYLGDSTIVITNTLPYPIDPDASNLNGGTYDPETRTITWTESVNITTVPQTISITKNVTIVFTDVPHTDRVAVNNAAATITLTEDRSRTSTDDESLTIAFKGTIKIYYRDVETGNTIKTTETHEGLIGDEFIVDEVTIKDYELTNPELAKAYYYTDDIQEVIFEYRKIKTEPDNPPTEDILHIMLVIGIPAVAIIGAAYIVLHRRR